MHLGLVYTQAHSGQDQLWNCDYYLLDLASDVAIFTI